MHHELPIDHRAGFLYFIWYTPIGWSIALFFFLILQSAWIGFVSFDRVNCVELHGEQFLYCGSPNSCFVFSFYCVLIFPCHLVSVLFSRWLGLWMCHCPCINFHFHIRTPSQCMPLQGLKWLFSYMHLRMFELAKDALNSRGFYVIGGYMSPVNDAYGKKAQQSSYQLTLAVLGRIQRSLIDSGLIPKESLKVMLLCGSDLLETFNNPGAWIRDQGVHSTRTL